MTPSQIAVNDVGNAEDFLAAIEGTIKNFNDGDLVSGIVDCNSLVISGQTLGSTGILQIGSTLTPDDSLIQAVFELNTLISSGLFCVEDSFPCLVSNCLFT
jgi:hypothetical protein